MREAPAATILMWKSDPLRCVLVVDPGKSFELRLFDGDRLLRTERLSSPDAVAKTASTWRGRATPRLAGCPD